MPEILVWMKAFIPGDVPGTRDGVGQSAGQKIIGYPAGLSSVATDCFWTDTRGFSNDFQASARITHWVQIDTTNWNVTSNCYCGTTHECDCEDGDIECQQVATPRWQYSQVQTTPQPGIYGVDFHGAAADPCVSTAPDVDYNLRILIDSNQRTVNVQGMIEPFPAFEAYCTVDGGGAHTLFQHSPTSGLMSLVGNANTGVTGNPARF